MADISSGSGKLQRAAGPLMARAAASYARAASSAVSKVPSQLQGTTTNSKQQQPSAHISPWPAFLDAQSNSWALFSSHSVCVCGGGGGKQSTPAAYAQNLLTVL
jgi:hypothetical protein